MLFYTTRTLGVWVQMGCFVQQGNRHHSPNRPDPVSLPEDNAGKTPSQDVYCPIDITASERIEAWGAPLSISTTSSIYRFTTILLSATTRYRDISRLVLCQVINDGYIGRGNPAPTNISIRHLSVDRALVNKLPSSHL